MYRQTSSTIRHPICLVNNNYHLHDCVSMLPDHVLVLYVYLVNVTNASLASAVPQTSALISIAVVMCWTSIAGLLELGCVVRARNATQEWITEAGSPRGWRSRAMHPRVLLWLSIYSAKASAKFRCNSCVASALTSTIAMLSTSQLTA